MKKYKLCDTTSLKKNNLILMFSGGYDSTAILLNLLEEGHKNIKCVYINIPNNSNKSKIEQKRCKKILKKVNKIFGTMLKLTIYTSMSIENDNTITFGQPFLYITTLAPYIQTKDDYVLFGFHRGSSIWNCHEIFEDAFMNINCILRCSRKNQCKYTPMVYSPLEWLDKWEILMYIKQYKAVYKLCWTCEGDFNTKRKKPCGKCLPCRNLKKAKKDIKYHKHND